jgi:hypothetical protein
MQHPPSNGALTRAIAKSPTGIQGLDEITNGGLPRGRPTLVCGGAGSGKTLGSASTSPRKMDDHIDYRPADTSDCNSVARARRRVGRRAR